MQCDEELGDRSHIAQSEEVGDVLKKTVHDLFQESGYAEIHTEAEQSRVHCIEAASRGGGRVEQLQWLNWDC